MPIEIVVPGVGESITEVELGDWLKNEGDWVEKDSPVVVIESEKATVEVPAPASGTVSKILKAKGAKAAVGETIGLMEEASRPAAEPATAAPASVPSPVPAPAADPPPPGDVRVMPAAARVLAQNQLPAADVTPSGPGGRLLKEDVERHVAERAAAPRFATPVTPAAAPVVAREAATADDEVVPMSPLRRKIAERLVQSQQTAALLTTFNEIDMSAVMALRKHYQDGFTQRYGIKLGFMSFFVKAAVDALHRVPEVNAEVRGTDIVYHRYYDIGVAVGGGRGLVVPVIRHADRLSFSEIELAIEDYGKRAQGGKLKPEELAGGTFTISNGGVYGSLLSTPIVNPPQVAILGLHKIEDRPVAVAGQVVIRPMMYVALTYDHRIIDGREAVTFLKRIKESVEDPTRILLEV
ncbi:MAG: 2-oxoglutarate dehydrogenase complex dihydrolipoyllysine-residue succinyltransferase [Deltaproteobacteria bacterium]|nr:2-oxoglutarate dehydrogenase complex dihydrolipoyllysine-residue succinyltransferase [Deltaproteobacteria bacterium]